MVRGAVGARGQEPAEGVGVGGVAGWPEARPASRMPDWFLTPGLLILYMPLYTIYTVIQA